MYSLDYFIAKFEAIDERFWNTGGLNKVNENKEITHCTLGHCGGYLTNEALALYKLTSSAIRKIGLPLMYEGSTPSVLGSEIYMVNDAWNQSLYPGATPKQRVLNLLKRIKVEEQERETQSAVEEAQNIVNQPVEQLELV